MRGFILLLFFTFALPTYAQRSDFPEIDFELADQIAKQHKGEELYQLPILAHNLTSTLQTDVERFRAIYYWVSHNISGEYYLNFTNDAKREEFQNDPEGFLLWNRQFKKEVFNRLLKDRVTLCTGYAYLVKELANLAGLECEIINGGDPTSSLKNDNLNTANHSWNAVKLKDKWYVCDPTWSSGFIDTSTLKFVFKYEDSYFLMEPSEFAKRHQPIDKQWTLIPQNSQDMSH